MPWKTSGDFPFSPINAISKKPYRGINTLILWAAAQRKGYTSGLWATYKQWKELGAQVRKDEKSTSIVFWKFFKAEDDSSEETDTKGKTIPMARDYAVFNASQVEGVTAPAEVLILLEERQSEIEDFFVDLGVNILAGGNRAYYQPQTDSVHMPPFHAFEKPAAYYSVLAHETTIKGGAIMDHETPLERRFVAVEK
jgi:antirestriction protein ArdC